LIRYITHNEIRKDAWDSCIQNSINPLPYALSWWLDAVSPGWDALIKDNYAAVMPLTWKKRFGFSYLRQPWYTQQLGIFSAENLSMKETSQFLDSVPDKYRYADIQLNASNCLLSNAFQINFRANFVLDLAFNYINIESNYHRNCRRNIQKALNEGLRVKPGPGPSVFSRFVEQNLDRSLAEKPAGLYKVLPTIIQATIDQSCGEISGVYDRNGELNAAGWFVHYFRRCQFMVCASTSGGRKKQAMYLLVDHMIREKAGTQTLFDFTGSNIPGVAYFNAGFGAVRQMYPVVRINRLPRVLRLFKK